MIKRDVLAGGKGVVVTTDREEARGFIEESIQSDGHILLERFLPGEKRVCWLLWIAQALFACQQAKITNAMMVTEDPMSGMGAYCPAPVMTNQIHEKVLDRIVQPMFSYLSSQSIPYRGVLYVGLDR